MSLSFNEIIDLKVGDLFWEYDQQFEVVTKPEIIDDPDSEYTQVTLFAQHINENGWHDSIYAPVEYLWTKEVMHYCPRIYRNQEYATPEQIKQLVNGK